MPLERREPSAANALKLLARRAELMSYRRADNGELADKGELAEITDALRAALEGAGTVRRLDLNRDRADEKLARRLASMEPVNPVAGEADLRDRFDPDRRVFLLEHPNLPGRPMNVVWVALQQGLPDALVDILDPEAPTADPGSVDTAVFYSIWNAQAGLAGLGGGRQLLEQVLRQLTAELPSLETFVTLSPIPGFRSWLSGQGYGSGQPGDLDTLCARYLVATSANGRPLDPVERFHLGNGARLLRICANADPSPLGLQRSWGTMVNYRYAPEDRTANRAALDAGKPALGDPVRQLLGIV